MKRAKAAPGPGDVWTGLEGIEASYAGPMPLSAETTLQAVDPSA